MKVISRCIIVLVLAFFASCKPEAPDLSSCKRALQPSSLNATDRAVIQVIINENWHNYIISESMGGDYSYVQDLGWNIQPSTINNATARNQLIGFIGKNDFEGKETITQFEYNCMGNTLELQPGEALHYIQFGLPGYNNDSTEALVTMQNGSWQWFNSSCDILLKKRNGVWQKEVNLCVVQ